MPASALWVCLYWRLRQVSNGERCWLSLFTMGAIDRQCRLCRGLNAEWAWLSDLTQDWIYKRAEHSECVCVFERVIDWNWEYKGQTCMFEGAAVMICSIKSIILWAVVYRRRNALLVICKHECMCVKAWEEVLYHAVMMEKSQEKSTRR